MNSPVPFHTGRDYFYHLTPDNMLRSLLAALAVIVIVFVAVSLLDIVIAVVYLRFYTTAAFVTTFAVGGIFAAVLGYIYGMEQSGDDKITSHWMLILFFLLCGVLFYFLLSKLEGREYGPALKAYGITLALGSLLFIGNKIK